MVLKRWLALVAMIAVLSCCPMLVSCGGSDQEPEKADEQYQTSEEYDRILEERQQANKESTKAEQDETIAEAQDQALQKAEDQLRAEREAQEQAAEEEAAQKAAEEQAAQEQAAATQAANADALRAELGIGEDYRPSFVHGEKPAEVQKYIMLHDTEGSGDPYSVVSSWDASGNLVAAHFIVGKDGTVVQCVPMDKIAHHAGFGDAGHDALYGVEDESRDDRAGTVPIGDWAPDYGMNSYSIGIEMVHVGGEGYYPEEQLAAVDKLIAYIDAYYGGNGGTIVDHKAWRSGNSDTSPEFADYLANYQDHRTHN